MLEGFLKPMKPSFSYFEKDFVVSVHYLLMMIIWSQSLKICIFLTGTHYFSIIDILAHGYKSVKKAIDWRLEINMKMLETPLIFSLNSKKNRTKLYPWPKIDLRVELSSICRG